MGNRIVQQPDRRYAVFSSIVDDFILENATEDMLITFFVDEATRHERKMVSDSLTAIRDDAVKFGGYSNGGYPTMTWKEAQGLRRRPRQ